MPTNRREVVITGLGPITAFGMGLEPFWDALIEGRSAVRPIGRFDASAFNCTVAAELSDEDFNVRTVVPKSYRKATKVMARDIDLAVGAAAAAVTDAGLTTKATDANAEPTIPPSRMGCHIGAGLIAADIDELTLALDTSRCEDDPNQLDLAEWGRAGMNNLTPLWLLKYLPNMLACHVTIIHDCQGPSNTITCAEASSVLSMGESMRAIERGAAEVCLSGGAESKLHPMGLLRQHFARRLVVTKNDDHPASIVRPFAPDARGTVLGEGGGILVLEAVDSARERKAKIYAKVAGFASTQSFCPDTVGLEPDENDEGISDVIEAAIRDADVEIEDIDAIAPLGTAISSVDEAEAAAIKRVFGHRTAEIPLITTIPNIGNCGAGAGALAVGAAAMSLNTQTLPARLNTKNASGLKANACESHSANLNTVLIVTPSLGGQNAAMVLQRQ